MENNKRITENSKAITNAIGASYDKLGATLTKIDSIKQQIAATDHNEGDNRDGLKVHIKELQDQAVKLQTTIDRDIGKLLEQLDSDLGTDVTKLIGICVFGDSDGATIADAPRLTRIKTAQVVDGSLKDAIHKLFEMITLRHIKEEMDTRTYMGRLDNAFSRMLEESKSLANHIGTEDSNGTGDNLTQQMRRLRDKLKDDVPEDWRADFPRHEQAYRLLDRKLGEIENLLESLYELADTDLVAFCQEANRSYVHDVTREAAMVAERSVFMSPWVMLAALTALLVTNDAISRTGSYVLMENRLAILAVSFLAMMLFSTFLGEMHRGGRVKKLYRQMHLRLDKLTALGHVSAAGQQPKTFFSGLRLIADFATNPWEMLRLFEQRYIHHQPIGKIFPQFDLARFANGPTRNINSRKGTLYAIKASIDYRNIWRRRILVFAGNLIAIAGVWVVLAISWPPHAKHAVRGSPKFVIGQASGGSSCLIAKGHIMRVGRNYVTIRRNEEAAPVQIDRAAIRRIDARSSDRPLCDNVQPRTVQAGAAPNWSPLHELRQSVAKLTSGLAAGFAGIVAIEAQRPIVPVLQVLPASTQSDIYVTRIYLGSGELAMTGARNAMLLPLFRTPVTGLAQRDPDGAYKFGRRSLPPAGTDDKRVRAFVDAIFQPVLRCVSDGGTVQLDVAGYASNSWKTPGTHDPALMNLNLAEGRRAAVLDQLWKGAKSLDPSVASRIEIMDAAGDFQPLDQIMAGEAPQRRFIDTPELSGPEAMARHLAGFVANPPGQTLGNELRELLSRSVLIQILGTGGPACMLPDPGQLQVPAQISASAADTVSAVRN